MPGCHRKPIVPQNSPSHIHREYPGRRGTMEPSGSATGGPFASLSTCSERNRVRILGDLCEMIQCRLRPEIVRRPSLLKGVHIRGQVFGGRPDEIHRVSLPRRLLHVASS